MDDWFNEIAASCALSTDVEHELLTSGFVIIPGPLRARQLEQLAQAYDAAVAGAAPADVRIVSTTIRVHDFVNRGPAKFWHAALRLRDRLQRICVARAHGKSEGRATALHPGRIHPP